MLDMKFVRENPEAVLAGFAEGYSAHIRTEEDTVYPAARVLLGPAEVQRMGQEMRRRRGAVPARRTRRSRRAAERAAAGAAR